MFYVEKWHRDNKKELAIIHIGPPFIVFLAFLGITLWSWLDAKNSIKNTQNEILSAHIHETETLISNRLTTYEDILRAGVGLFDSSNEVTREEWKRFVDILDIPNRYPGVIGVGYVKSVPASQVSEHERTYRDSTYPNYTIRPKTNDPVYLSVVYLEPRNPANDRAIGFNAVSEKSRVEALNRARDTGSTTITGLVTLVQDQESNGKEGFLMFVPHYINHTVQEAEADRRKNLAGFVYAPFRSKDLISEITTQMNLEGYSFQVYSGEQNSENLLYTSPEYNNIARKSSKIETTKEIMANNQKWIIKGLVDTSIVTKSDNNRPLTILWIGTVFSLFLALFIYMLLLNRTRKISSKETEDIQNAKDELLALASHQLRTPATGVKQYLGLLREGYAGALNRDQRTYINKAYESNERQLNTINQMLFVARSDAGKIKLTVRRMDIGELVKDILDEQKSMIAEKKHKIKINIPDHPVDIYGDEQYLRMALENVINNAIKYTEPGGKISINVEAAGNNVKILIEDNGVGVNHADLPLLFRKFSRIPNELTSKVAGSGIGLYLTKSIIQAHNGSVSFESIVNTGSSVTITLPSKLPKETGYL